MSYDDFKAVVRATGEGRGAQGGLIPIPELRRELGPGLSRELFEEYLFSLHAEGTIHLLGHVDPGSLPGSVRRDCVTHPDGALLYWIRWL